MNATLKHTQGHRQRLRHRLIKTKFEGFEDYELLELLLTYAISRRDVKPLAKQLITHFGSLKKVLEATYIELIEMEGVGPRTATLILMLRSIMRRYFHDEAKESKLLNSPKIVVDYCRASLEGEKNEIFEVLYLSSRNRLIKSQRLFEGTVNEAAVYPRRVIEGALSANAAGMIFVHNHPSGDPTPSEEDRVITKNLVQAASLLGLSVHDHIIVGHGRYFSFKAAGFLDLT